jgi:hypothetical protein
MGSCLIIGSAYYKSTNAKVEQANGIISDTLRAFQVRQWPDGRHGVRTTGSIGTSDWDAYLLHADSEFTINNAASTFGDGLTPFFIDRGPGAPPGFRALRRVMNARRVSHSRTTLGGCKRSKRRCESCWQRHRDSLRRSARRRPRSWTRAGSSDKVFGVPVSDRVLLLINNKSSTPLRLAAAP